MRVRSHPGEILRHEYLDPLKMSASALAEQIGVPANRVTEIIRGRRDVTADTALRLAEFFDTSPEFWMNLQTAHDISRAKIERAQSGVHQRAPMKISAAKVSKSWRAPATGKALAASALSKKPSKTRVMKTPPRSPR